MEKLIHKVNDELHARPDMRLRAPVQCYHFLHSHSLKSNVPQNAQITDFCEKSGLAAPSDDMRFHVTTKDDVKLKWEAHTESNSYTIVTQLNENTPTQTTLSDYVQETLQYFGAPTLITGVEITILRDSDIGETSSFNYAKSLFTQGPILGGWMSDKHATVWSSYRPDEKGFIKFIIVGHNIGEGRLGRLVHRLLDIEDYRMKAMMALPEAHNVMKNLNEQEPLIDHIMERLANAPCEAEQETLLAEITRVAANIEHLITKSAYRFSAAKAYAAITNQRFTEIREEIQDGHERITTFLSKRINPAMRTCEAAEHRANALAVRVTRAANLLNTMVDLVNKKQNQSILKSMEQRARMQVALQMAVEGFSIIAISYYGTGLLAYMLKSAKIFGIKIDVELYIGLAVPAVVLLSWLGVKLAKRTLKKIT